MFIATLAWPLALISMQERLHFLRNYCRALFGICQIDGNVLDYLSATIIY